MHTNFLIGFLLGAAFGLLAWRAGALTSSGALAATGVGGVIFGLGGLPWAALLLTFFISSSALSRAFRQKKHALSEKFAKGTSRDWGQVTANGGLGAALVLAQAINPDEIWPWIAYAGAMAAVNADTWATELGVLSPSPPRLITTGRVVERGASGGITFLGSLASALGAALIGLAAWLFSTAANPLALIGLATLAGLLGSLIDSLLGATIQGIYYCPVCNKETEQHPVHTCSNPTRHVRGLRWLNNDLVNLAASLAGASLITAGWFLLR